MLIDTTHYASFARVAASLDSVVGDTAFHARMNRLIVDTTLYTRLEQLMADTAWLAHSRRLVPDSALYPRLLHLSRQLDSLLACLREERGVRRRR